MTTRYIYGLPIRMIFGLHPTFRMFQLHVDSSCCKTCYKIICFFNTIYFPWSDCSFKFFFPFLRYIVDINKREWFRYTVFYCKNYMYPNVCSFRITVLIGADVDYVTYHHLLFPTVIFVAFYLSMQ